METWKDLCAIFNMTKRGRKPLTPEQIEERKVIYKQIALDYHAEHNKTPRIKDIKQAQNILKIYDTWNDFIRDCGLKVNHVWFMDGMF